MEIGNSCTSTSRPLNGHTRSDDQAIRGVFGMIQEFITKGSEIHFVVPQLAQQSPRVFGMRLKPRGVQKFIVGDEEWAGLKLESVGDTGLRMDFWIDPEDRTLLRWTVPSQFTEVVLSRGD